MLKTSVVSRQVVLAIGLAGSFYWSELTGLSKCADQPPVQSARDTRSGRAVPPPPQPSAPLMFVANAGQIHRDVRYYGQGAGWQIYFTPREVVFAFLRKSPKRAETGVISPVSLSQTPKPAVLQLRFVRPSRNVTILGRKPTITRVNHFAGLDSSRWRTGVETFRQVVYRELWPGIDLVFREEKGQFKYEFALQPGSRVSHIGLAYKGADRLSLDNEGNLLVDTSFGTIRDDRPISYQEKNGKRVPVASRFVLTGNKEYGFSVDGHYDTDSPLIIDPGLVFSTFLGGTQSDSAVGVAVDASENVYVTGSTQSVNFPTAGAFDVTVSGQDAFVSKFDPTGTSLLFSTYLGGVGADFGSSIALDPAGNIYVAGTTVVSAPPNDFPTTPGAFDRIHGGFQEVFITKLNASGQIVYSTFLGGSRNDSVLLLPQSLAVDSIGQVYLTGETSSRDFPTTAGAFDPIPGGGDVFLSKLNAAGSALLYSTVIAGSIFNAPRALVLDSASQVYVTGQTNSSDFPTTPNAFSRSRKGNVGTDVFIVKIDTNAAGAASFVYGTYLGGSGGLEFPGGIGLDVAGNVYVAGSTNSNDFPTTEEAFDRIGEGDLLSGGQTNDPTTDIFVTKLRMTPTGTSLLYSTYLGGCARDISGGTVVDASGNVYLTGFTSSATFVTTVGAFDASYNGGFQDAFVAKVNTNLTGEASLAYSSFLGGSGTDSGSGIALDASGHLVIVGSTVSANFPSTPGSFDPVFNGVGLFPTVDAFVAKVNLTPQVQLESIAEQIQDLISSTLNSGQAHALTAKLETAIQRLEQGNITAAVNVLEGFIHQAQAMVNAGNLSAEEGERLINAAQRIIAQLSV